MSVTLVVGACGGREAHPVMVNQAGDMGLSCQQIQHEITLTQQEMDRIEPKTSKVGKNVALGILGWFVIVPWFFMDFKNADKTEYKALEARRSRLNVLASQKGCAQGQGAQPQPYQAPVQPQPYQPQPYQAPAQPQPYQPQPYQPQPYQPPQSYDPPAPYQAPAQSGGQGTEQYSF